MVRKYFGTDGIRGRANGVITPELALKVGQAAGLIFQNGEHRHRVLNVLLDGVRPALDARRHASLGVANQIAEPAQLGLEPFRVIREARPTVQHQDGRP